MIKRQRSFAQTETGQLYLVPTPIGNLEDITFRALRILKEVDIIAAEDTRQTQKLLNHFDIKKKTVSYHEHNKQKSGEQLLADLRNGSNIALVSDAGMPAISDPGYELVASAIEENHVVIPLPGANAALTALIASGITSEHFYFYGFLNRQKKVKKQQLEKLMYIQDTFILYESPHRLKETLILMLEILGDRKIVISRELTKKFEEFIRGSISECVELCETEVLKGEFCIIVEGADESSVVQENNWWEDLSVEEHVEHYITIKSESPKEAIKKVAKERNVPKRDVYQLYHTK